MPGFNGGILRNAYPLSEAQIKEVEKDVILNNKCIAYLDENNQICFAEPFDPVVVVKNFAWNQVHQMFEQEGVFFKNIYEKTGLDTFTLIETLQKTDIDGSWIRDRIDTLAAGVYKTGAIDLLQNNKGSEAVMMASWDETIDSGALTITDEVLSVGTGIVGSKLPDNLPEKNQYGFYYDVAYGMAVDGMVMSFRFHEDGSAVVNMPDDTMDIPAGVIVYGDHSIDLSAMEVGIGVVSDDGTTITFADAGMLFTLGEPITIAGDLVLPTDGSVSSIYSNAFNGVPITGMIFPEVFDSINNNALYNCNSLITMVIPNSVTSIGDGAFYHCRSLTSLELPSSVRSIGYEAFAQCDSLTSVVIPDGVTSIGNSAFAYCDGLTSVTIGNGVTTISDSAFAQCGILTSITYRGTIAQWNEITFGKNWNYNVPATYVQCSDGQVTL